MELNKIKKAHFASAKIVEKLGNDYLIFFERIHQELIKAEKSKDLQELAVQVAKGAINTN